MQATMNTAPPPVQQINGRELAAGTVQHPQQQDGVSFFQMMMQQLTGDGQTTTDMSVLSQLLAAQGEDQDGEDGLLLAAQLMAQMMALPTAELASLLEQTAQTTEGEAVLAAGGLVQSLTNLLGQSTVQTEATALTQQAPVSETAGQQSIPFEVVLNSQTQSEAQQSVVPLATRFQNAVTEAQRLIKEQPQEQGETEELDVDGLQKKVDAERAVMQTPIQPRNLFSVASAKTEATQTTSTDNLLGQVTTDIAKNLGDGKSEFVIKLQPEGLGEITVKMMAEGGKTTLSILTSSAQTERLLNNEIANLREALRPLGAEVKEVISNSPDFNLFQHQQQRSNEGRQQLWEYYRNNADFYNDSDGLGIEDSLLMHQQLLASSQMLYRYI